VERGGGGRANDTKSAAFLACSLLLCLACCDALSGVLQRTYADVVESGDTSKQTNKQARGLNRGD
jgi:hypothetical protein